MTLIICPNHQRLSTGSAIWLGIRNETVLIEKKEAHLENIRSTMEQFSSLRLLMLGGMLINSELVRDIAKYKRKIVIIEINYTCCFELTKTEFLKLTECCDKLHIENIKFASPNRQLNENDRFTNMELLSDEFIESIISKLYVFKPYFTPSICRGKDLVADGTRLTDRLLLEIIPKNWPYVFTLCYCQTSFTLCGVMSFIKLADSRRSEIAEFELGAFVVENKDDAVRKLSVMANELNYDIEASDDVYEIVNESYKQCRVWLCEPNLPFFENTIFTFQMLYN